MAFANGMEQILAEGAQVKAVTPDRQGSMRKTMGVGMEAKEGEEKGGYHKEFGIMHGFDQWHTRVKKKLLAASKRKDCEELYPQKCVKPHVVPLQLHKRRSKG
ncbi:unnamed protein product [Boreogadus saida]